MNNFLILILILISKFSIAGNVHCPKTPLKITIGQTIEGGWYPWFADEKGTYSNKIYYSYYEKNIYIPIWDGTREVYGRKKGNLIGCCYSDKSKGVKEVCVTKIVGRMVLICQH